MSPAEDVGARPPRIGMVSLGCPKAGSDTERLLTQLRAEGYLLVADYAEADLVLVNTCGFIDAAVQESLDAIAEAIDENGRVVVTGCLGAREQGEFIRRAQPKVLAVTGPQQDGATLAAIHRVLPPRHDPLQDLVPPQGLRLTPRHYAYLKIAEGCNQSCSFCVIPSMRGKLLSREPGDILREAEALVAAGCRELLIISQDTAAYGSDRRYRTAFADGRPTRAHITDLCTSLAALGAWVRLHYVYPYPHVDALVDLMADGKILPYLDIPLQHGSPAVLKAMRRPAASDKTLDRIARWRRQLPDLTLRSTFIVGFPGESEADFRLLLDFLRAAELDRVGCFSYSPVEGAAANALADPVPEVVKEERRQRFMEVQAEISAARLRRRVGQECLVVVDGFTESGHLMARSAAEAPEIDGIIQLDPPTGGRPAAGQRLWARITGSTTHDLHGTVLATKAE